MAERIEELIEQVAAATGPDDCLEVDLIEEFGWPSAHYTEDLNAVVALCERELPGPAKYLELRGIPGQWYASVGPNIPDQWRDAAHSTPALALLLAFLRALRMQDKGR